MVIAIQRISPVAHWPLVLGVIRQRNVAALIDTCCPPHPAKVLSWGRGVEALLLAMLDGPHALYTVGTRLEARGMLPLLPPGLSSTALNDYRWGQILDALCAAHLHRVFSAVALNALEVSTIPTPWLYTRRPRRSPDTVPMKGQPPWAKDLSRLGRRMGTATMGLTISSTSS